MHNPSISKAEHDNSSQKWLHESEGVTIKKMKRYVLDVFLGVKSISVNKTNTYLTCQVVGARKKTSRSEDKA